MIVKKSVFVILPYFFRQALSSLQLIGYPLTLKIYSDCKGFCGGKGRFLTTRVLFGSLRSSIL